MSWLVTSVCPTGEHPWQNTSLYDSQAHVGDTDVLLCPDCKLPAQVEAAGPR